MGHPGVLRLLHAAGRLPAVRRQSGARALGRRQRHVDDGVSLVPGRVGPTDELEGGLRGFSRELGQGVRRGETGSFLGPGPSRPGGHRGHRRR